MVTTSVWLLESSEALLIRSAGGNNDDPVQPSEGPAQVNEEPPPENTGLRPRLEHAAALGDRASATPIQDAYAGLAQALLGIHDPNTQSNPEETQAPLDFESGRFTEAVLDSQNFLSKLRILANLAANKIREDLELEISQAEAAGNTELADQKRHELQEHISKADRTHENLAEASWLNQERTGREGYAT